MDNNRIAIVPGSFDPMTNGHIFIVKKAMELYDFVYVAVMINDQKQYMFSLEEREAIAKACLSNIENVCVISSRDWLWHLAKEIGACAIVKGYRNDVDLEYEKNMARFNEEHCPDVKTVLLKTDDALANISSTMIRERIRSSQSLEKFLPQDAIEIIERIKPKA